MTELFSSSSFENAVLQVCSMVMKEDIPQVDGACVFGSNGGEDLGFEILKFCTDIGYTEIVIWKPSP